MISKDNIHRSEKYLRLIQANSISPEYPQIHLSEKEFEWAQKEMKKLGMGSLLGVGQGSIHESQLVIMKWNGSKNKKLHF